MTFRKHFFSTGLLLLFSVLFVATVTEKTIVEQTYRKTQKEPEAVKVSYTLPTIKPTGKTTQSQTKGGVTISAEIVPFRADKKVRQTRDVTYADPNKVGFDMYEISQVPSYVVTPNEIQFNIRIRNNEQVPLKLSEIGFALIIDGVQWSFPSGYLDDWNKGLILTGFEKEYQIKGPQLEGLNNAQVVYIFLNGVPTSYNKAGSITQKSNFEWYFECATETVQKDAVIRYAYEAKPIHKERCQACSGKGHFEKTVSCKYCDGKGKYVNKEGKVRTCYNCGGDGKLIQKDHCYTCAGKGEKSFPKSQAAPVASRTTWTGWEVEVKTNPPGAEIKVVDTKTGEYYSAGSSNKQVDWYTSGSKPYPIIVEYMDQSVKVMPYTAKGSKIPRVIVDFTGAAPVVERGQVVK